MFGNTQKFKTPTNKRYRHVGRGKHRIGGVPWWETRNGVSFGNAYGYYGTEGQIVDPETQEAGHVAGEETDAPVTAGGEGGESNSSGATLGASAPGTV
jgi:hypothetical protein